MADIKKFNGFVAPDGSMHDTAKKAIDYTKALKAKTQLAELVDRRFKDASNANSGDGAMPAGFAESDCGRFMEVSGLVDFIIANKAEILAAFDQDVRLRAPRKPRAKKEAPAVATVA